MLGESLLIAPVMDPGTSTRKVTLPRGEWYDFWEDARYEGPGNIILPVTLERIPLFVRAGTILTLEKEDSLELDIYPISDGERQAQLYSDFGDGYGDYRVDTFRMQGSKDEILITWEEVGEYPFPYKSIRVRLAHRDPLECLVDGAPVPIRGRNVEINRFQQLRIRYAVIRDYN
jgi:alpha-glucosidase